MSGNDPEFGDAVPFAVTKRAADTNGEFVRFEATVHPAPDAAAADVSLDHERWLIDNPDEHVHPDLEEHIEVLAGEYAVEVDGTERRLEAGETATVQEGRPHRHWNPGARPARVVHEHHPALGSDEHAETMWALAQDGKTDAKGIPNPLRFAVISRAHPGLAYTTAAPVALQKAAFAVLAPIGRLAGYEATYPATD